MEFGLSDKLVLPRSVVLVGMMGAGKSTIGRRLAGRLDVGFVDADTEIEAAAGCTISEIFARHGEPAFRDGERRVIARLLEGRPRIIATGGGAFNDPRTREEVAARGISVWLRADVDLLLRRVMRRNNRPLLAQGDPRETLERLLVERTPYYACADITVDSADGPLDVTTDRVMHALRRFLADHPELREASTA